jgi:hypothetical protein
MPSITAWPRRLPSLCIERGTESRGTQVGRPARCEALTRLTQDELLFLCDRWPHDSRYAEHPHHPPDFGLGKVVLQDAYFNDTMFRYANLQVGKYKSPYDLERLQSDHDLEFSQRSEIQNLVPNRDYGAQHASRFENRLTYQVALMNGVPNNTATVESDNNDGKDFVGPTGAAVGAPVLSELRPGQETHQWAHSETPSGGSLCAGIQALAFPLTRRKLQDQPRPMR